MAKKRVLNSKNPKYWAKKTENKPKIKKRILFKEVKGVKMYGTWYEKDTDEDSREQSQLICSRGLGGQNTDNRRNQRPENSIQNGRIKQKPKLGLRC